MGGAGSHPAARGELGHAVTLAQDQLAAAKRQIHEQAFLGGLNLYGRDLPRPVREHPFHPERLWRFDFAWPDLMLAVEIHGGIWRKGAHSGGSGAIRDAEKATEAARLGWVLLTFTPDRLEGDALRLSVQVVRECIEGLTRRAAPLPSAPGGK